MSLFLRVCVCLVVIGLATTTIVAFNKPVLSELSAEEVRMAAATARISAPVMWQRYRSVPHASNETWGNRVVEVSGRVVLVGHTEKNGDCVLLQAGLRGHDPVVCWMAVDRPWDAIAPGMSVVLKGQVVEIAPGSSPQLRHCWKVSAGESEDSRQFTAEDLCRTYCERRAEVHDLLSERWVWVTGRIASVDAINDALFLQGHATTQVRCTLAGQEASWDRDLASGDWIQLLGKISNGDERKVDLVDCLPPRRIRVEDVAESTAQPSGQ